MASCRYCGGVVLPVLKDLYKCLGLCGQYFRDTPMGPLPKLEITSTVAKLRAHEAGVEEVSGGEGLDADMLIFSNRVAEKIVSTEGLTPEMTKQVKKVQDGFRRELIDVLQGKRGLFDWVSKTKTTLGLHQTKILSILYEAATGLKNPELIELQEFCGKALETGVMP